MTKDYVLVPREPTEEMWGGLARDMVFWQRWGKHTNADLYKHLRSIGTPIPDWLLEELPDVDRVCPKGTVAACIYKAMLSASPQHIGGDHLKDCTRNPCQHPSHSPQQIGRPLRGADELLPCPFCGEDACAHEGGNGWYIACTYIECFCALGEGYDRDAMPDHSFVSKEDAVQAWNKRAALSPAPGGSSIPMGVTDWQPIETAPKDGTEIIAELTIGEHLEAAKSPRNKRRK